MAEEEMTREVAEQLGWVFEIKDLGGGHSGRASKVVEIVVGSDTPEQALLSNIADIENRNLADLPNAPRWRT